MAGIVGAGPVLVEPAVAAVAGTSGAPIFLGMLTIMLIHSVWKGETEWPIDVDDMEDGE